MQQRRPVRRALLSVSDKAGIIEFARALSARGVELLSTGHRPPVSRKGLPVTEVSDYTGFPEMMDGRVKTLHPKYTAASSAVAARRCHYGTAPHRPYRYGCR